MTRRELQVALGVLWIIDAALQAQPFMFTRGFATQVIAGAAQGQPGFVAAPVRWAANVIAAHPVFWNVPFALIQLALGVGLLAPRTAKPALAASIAWALGVWYFGEGLGGLLGGGASLAAGAPGSALLLAILAAAAWPNGDERLAAWLPFAWAVVWVGGAVLAVPNALLVAVEYLVGMGVLVRWTRPVAAALGLVLAVAWWVGDQQVGGIASGRATDPNTGPLLALMALTLMPATSRANASIAAARSSRSSAARYAA